MVPTTDVQAIADTVRHWAAQPANAPLLSRLQRAHVIALSPAVIWDPDQRAHVVRSSDGSQWYRVDLVARSCSCPDSVDGRAPRGWCKHLLAVAILGAAEHLLIRRRVDVPRSEAGYAWADALSARRGHVLAEAV